MQCLVSNRHSWTCLTGQQIREQLVKTPSLVNCLPSFMQTSCFAGTWSQILPSVGASLMAQTVKKLPAIQETQIQPWVRKILWRRKWQHTPVFLPGEFHGQRSLVGYFHTFNQCEPATASWAHQPSGGLTDVWWMACWCQRTGKLCPQFISIVNIQKHVVQKHHLKISITSPPPCLQEPFPKPKTILLTHTYPNHHNFREANLITVLPFPWLAATWVNSF